MIIDGRKISNNESPYIVAEMSGNHGLKIERAIDLIQLAHKSGADAIKIQTYRPDTITLNHDSADFLIPDGIWKGKKLYDLYSEAMTPWEWHEELFRAASDLGVTMFSSPFDRTAVDLLEKLGAPAYKIASYEIVDIPLIQYVAETGKPIIISTGLATVDEIKEAVDAAGNSEIALLYCVSGYPTPIADVNLATMIDMREKFEVPIGLSDHTKGIAVPVAATALGATIIEKHIKSSNYANSIDGAFSLDEKEFSEMTAQCRAAHTALGAVSYSLKDSEGEGRKFRRSLYAVEEINKGELFSAENVRSIRPGLGLHTRYFEDLLGRKAARKITRGTPIDREMIEGGLFDGNQTEEY